MKSRCSRPADPAFSYYGGRGITVVTGTLGCTTMRRRPRERTTRQQDAHSVSSHHQISRSESILVLTRKLDEAIVIGGEIVVRVVAIRGGRIRLGIEAPKAMAVEREEIRGQAEAVGSDRS